jgi:hypothetical protein
VGISTNFCLLYRVFRICFNQSGSIGRAHGRDRANLARSVDRRTRPCPHPPPHRPSIAAAPRRPSSGFRRVFGRRTVAARAPPPRARAPSPAPLTRPRTADVAAPSFSAATAPQATARRPNNPLLQVNTSITPNTVAGVRRAAPSSASFTCFHRARRRALGDGSPRGGSRRVRLAEMQLTVPPRTAAVAGSAGDAVAGGGRGEIRTRAGARANPTR